MVGVEFSWTAQLGLYWTYFPLCLLISVNFCNSPAGRWVSFINVKLYPWIWCGVHYSFSCSIFHLHNHIGEMLFKNDQILWVLGQLWTVRRNKWVFFFFPIALFLPTSHLWVSWLRPLRTGKGFLRPLCLAVHHKDHHQDYCNCDDSTIHERETFVSVGAVAMLVTPQSVVHSS